MAAAAAAETLRVSGSNTPSFSAEDLQHGRVTILVDALDEVVDDASRSSILRSVLEFHTRYPRCLIVVSSRNYTFLAHLSDLRAFVEYRLVPISYKEAQLIIQRIQRNQGLPPERSQELVRRLQQVHGMELNPLLVTVFAASTDYDRRDIPANITELFKKYTELMLGRWDSTKGLKHQYHAPLKDFVLTQLAYEMHRRRVTELEVSEFEALVRSQLDRRGHTADVVQLLDELINRSGLFRTIGTRIEFRHLLIQEFFAGRGIPSSALLESLVGDDWWQRAIVFYYGSRPGEGEALGSILKNLTVRPSMEQFTAAVTVGLSLQASYLLELTEKTGILRWVLKTLASTKEGFLAAAPNHQRSPLTAFLFYYLFGRDAAACSTLATAHGGLRDELLAEAIQPAEREARQFWLIVGLLECGEMERSEEELADFQPQDPRYLLAIHLGTFLIQHHRVTSKAERDAAKRIQSSLHQRILGLRTELMREVQSELLEVQEGKLKALPMPESQPGEPEER